MVNKTCSWGACRSDSRRKHHEDMKGVTFKRFPQPRTQKERCMEWIRRCNRPHSQLHIGNVGYYHFVCSKHFQDGAEDPVSASNATKTPKSGKGRSSKHPNETPAKQVCLEISTCNEENQTGVLRGDDGAMSDVEVEEASACGNLPILPQLFSPVKASKTEPLSSKTATIADILSKESPRKSCKRSLKYKQSKSASESAYVTISLSKTEIVPIGKERFMKYIQSNDEKCFHYTGVPNRFSDSFLTKDKEGKIPDQPILFGLGIFRFKCFQFKWVSLYYIFFRLMPYVSNIKLWDGPNKSEKKEKEEITYIADTL